MSSQVGGLDGRPDSTIFRQLDSVEQLGQKDKKMKRPNGKNTKRQKPPSGKRTLLNGLDLVAGKRRPLLIQVIGATQLIITLVDCNPLSLKIHAQNELF